MDFEGVFDGLRAEAGLKDFKLRLLKFVERIGYTERKGEPPTELARLLRMIIYSPRRDQFLYVRKPAAQMLLHIIPHLPDELEAGPPDTEPAGTSDDLPLVTALLRDHVAAPPVIFGAAKALALAIEAALRQRLQELNSRF